MSSNEKTTERSPSAYSGNKDIIQTLVDCIFDCVVLFGKVSTPFFKWLMDGWINTDGNKFNNIEKHSDKFFINSNIKIGDEIPVLISKSEEENYYSFIYDLPLGMCIVDFERQADRIATFFDCNKNDLRFMANGNKVIIRIMKPQVAFVYDPDKYKNNDFTCPLGLNTDMELTCINLFDSNNYGSYSAGGAGSGKTRTIRLITAHLVYNVAPEDLEIVINDYKGIDFIEFKYCKHVIKYITGSVATIKMLKEQEEEMERRYKIFASLDKCNSIWTAREKGYRIPFRLLIIEEASAFSENKEYQARMKNISERGRAAGIIPISILQFPNKDNLPSNIKSNCSVKFGHRVDSELRSEVLAGKDSGLEKLRGYGHNKLFSPEHPNGEEYQEFDLTDETVEQIVNANLKESTEEEPIEVYETIGVKKKIETNSNKKQTKKNKNKAKK